MRVLEGRTQNVRESIGLIQGPLGRVVKFQSTDRRIENELGGEKLDRSTQEDIAGLEAIRDGLGYFARTEKRVLGDLIDLIRTDSRGSFVERAKWLGKAREAKHGFDEVNERIRALSSRYNAMSKRAWESPARIDTFVWSKQNEEGLGRKEIER